MTLIFSSNRTPSLIFHTNIKVVEEDLEQRRILFDDDALQQENVGIGLSDMKTDRINSFGYELGIRNLRFARFATAALLQYY